MDDQNEMFIIVDRDDKVLGYRTRYDCHHNRKLIHRSSGVIIFNDKGQILLQKRSKDKDLNPNWYTISAAGHVSKGENYKQTAQRELKEELGINIPLQKKKKHLVEIDRESEMHCLFTAEYNGPFYPNKQEVDKVEFVDVDYLRKMQSKLTPFAISSLKQLGLL